MPTPEALLEQVIDEQTFVEFLTSLAADRESERMKEAEFPSSPWGPGANGWENGTIEAFLGAASAWAISSRHRVHSASPEANPWRRCSAILLAGKFYE